MTDSDAYAPISCEDHGRYELAILRRERWLLEWRGEDGSPVAATVWIRDLYTSRGAELVLAVDAGGREFRVRLDRISRGCRALA